MTLTLATNVVRENGHDIAVVIYTQKTTTQHKPKVNHIRLMNINDAFQVNI